MKQQNQVEDKLRRAIEHAAPVYRGELYEELQKSMPTAPAPQRRRGGRLLRAAAAIAACAVLAFGGLGLFRLQQSRQDAATIVLDVNPSIQVTVNAEERVLRVRAENRDAERILDGMDLKNVPLNVAINALIGSLLKNGYINELANSILISVEGTDAGSAAQLEQRLTGEINELLSGFGIDGAILAQTLRPDDAAAALANEYGISRGKATLIQTLVAQNPKLQAGDLAGQTIHELNLLLQNAAAQAGDSEITRIGTASEGNYIGAEAAKAAAFRHAGIAETDALRLTVEMDMERGRLVYEVDFDAGVLEYEYDIDALTGEVVKFHTEPNDDLPRTEASPVSPEPSPSTGAPTAADIGEEAAINAALEHAGLKRSDITDVRVKKDYDNGRAEYDVDFVSGGTRYEYEIDAADGSIRSYDREKAKTSGGSPSANTATDAANDIGKAAAKSIAFAQAGVSAGSVSRVSVERDRDNGVLVYEVEFVSGDYEYEFEIDASTGAVLGRSRDARDDD